MSKFLKISGSLGLVGLSFVLVREKQRYDALPDKSKYVFVDDIVNSENKDKLMKICEESITNLFANMVRPTKRPESPLMRQRGHEPNLDNEKSKISPEHVEIAIVPLEYEEHDPNSESRNKSTKKDVSDEAEPEKMNIMDKSTSENRSIHDIPQDSKDLGNDDGQKQSDALKTDPVTEDVVTVTEPVGVAVTKMEGSVNEAEMQSKEEASSILPVINSEKEKETDEDSMNVLDVKVAFSNENMEQVLDPKSDFSSKKMEYEKDNSTLSGISKSCMELGVVLGDLMGDVPDIQPRLSQVYKELQQLFQDVSNLQKEQDALISKALQEQGSEFSQILEQQWEASVNAIASQAQELEQEYSQKLNEFKVAFTNQMELEEKEKLDNMRKDYEMDKSTALSSQEQELIQKWEMIVAEKVDQERDGRLAKLDHLAVKVQVLQNVTEDISFRLEQKYSLQKIEIALENLSVALRESPGSIEAEFNKLWLVGSKYPFIAHILSSLPKDIAVAGLRKNIRSIKYMPENGGAISYLISSFGPRSRIGEITSEVLENSSDSIAVGDIDSAARQLNRLRGWQRVLSLDWLADARRYLELKQALDVIHDYVRLEKLEVI